MGAKHYADHEIRYLTYSLFYNGKVRGENAALARQLKRSKGAVVQQKGKIRRVLLGQERDPQIERILGEFGGVRRPRVRRVEKQTTKKPRGILDRLFDLFRR